MGRGRDGHKVHEAPVVSTVSDEQQTEKASVGQQPKAAEKPALAPRREEASRRGLTLSFRREQLKEYMCLLLLGLLLGAVLAG